MREAKSHGDGHRDGHRDAHLDAERLAAFDHDAASADETAHLAVCAACRAEREAFTALAVLAERSAPTTVAMAPLTQWESLSARLRTEGLLSPPTDARVPVAPVSSWATGASRTLLRFAAALTLVLGGAFAGRLSVRPPAPMIAAAAAAGLPAQRAPDGDDNGAGFQSVGQATDALDQAQRTYERASLWLAANDTTVRGSDVYRARLAALDQMMAASRAGLRDVPQDPLLSRYYRAAYAAREATLQQLGSALPIDKTLEGY